MAHEPLVNGRTVFERLAADAIDERAVSATVDELTVATPIETLLAVRERSYPWGCFLSADQAAAPLLA